MKRFLLFGGHDYYPNGGWDDFIGSYDEHSDAMKEVHRRRNDGSYNAYWIDWFHVIDLETGKRV